MGYEKGHRIIKKWFQPYVILETVKKYFEVTDITFDGKTKLDSMKNFISEINSSERITIGLYMKNVNKFYLLKLKNDTGTSSDITVLENLLSANNFDNPNISDFHEWVEVVKDTDKAINLIDMGKAEAAFIMKQDW